ncbi:MAG: hypothetical protein AAGA09_00920 [Pseudomonadota bacterium]
MSDDHKKGASIFDDDVLSTYLDGELAEADMLAVEKAVAADPAVRARLDRLRRVDAALGAALRLDTISTPDRVKDMLRAPASAGRANEDANSVPVRGGDVVRFPTFFRMRTALPMAAAASLALVAGYVAGLMQPSSPPAPGFAIAGVVNDAHPLFSALETTPSGETVAVKGAVGEIVRLLLTYRTNEGALCREFDIGDAERSLRSVACRGADAWEIKIAAAAGGITSAQAYETASAGDVSFIADYVDATMDGDPFDAEDEKAAIRAEWRLPEGE